MTEALPRPLAAYFAAATHYDIEAMLVAFAEDAIVKDEGQTMRGRAAIRAWLEETRRKYQPSLTVVDVNDTHGTIAVATKVAGNFPGSPIQLDFTFRLAGEKIASLEIG